jgi:hypothetical protein
MKFVVCFVVLVLSALPVNSRVLPVPSEYPTIRIAFLDLQSGDTVLVAPGVYVESLEAPPLDFVLRGETRIDSIATEFAIIDPSDLPGSDTLKTLTLTGGTAVFEDVVFRNRGQMIANRPNSDGSGILGDSSVVSVSFYRCMFDSLIRTFSNASFIHVSKCRLIGCDGGVYSGFRRGYIKADSTWFDGTSNLVNAQEGCQLENCTFTHQDFGRMLIGLGDSVFVDNCRFVGVGFRYSEALLIRPRCGSQITNCIVEDVVVANDVVVKLRVDCAEDPISPECAIKFENNKFVRCGSAPGSTVPCGAMIKAHCGTGSDAFIAHIEGNEFDSTMQVTDDASCITTDAFCRIENNTFGDALTPNKPQIHFYQPFGPDTVLVRNNSFARDFYSIRHVYAGATIDARNCWWGDPSGPYHGELNPNGLGAQVDNHVMFIPWLTVDPDSSDTTEVSLDPSDPYLPELYSLSAFPNPFNSLTQINIDVAHPNTYDVVLFDITGRQIEKIYQGKIDSHHTLSFESHALPSGTYFLQLRAGSSAYAAAKLALLK